MVGSLRALDLGVSVEALLHINLGDSGQVEHLADLHGWNFVPEHPDGDVQLLQGADAFGVVYETVSFLLKAATEVKATVEDVYARDSCWLEEKVESVATVHLLAVSATCNKRLMFMISTMYFSETFLVNLKLWAIETSTAGVFTLRTAITRTILDDFNSCISKIILGLNTLLPERTVDVVSFSSLMKFEQYIEDGIERNNNNGSLVINDILVKRWTSPSPSKTSNSSP